jgi:uncharacterized cupin superfamily protein
MIWARATWSRSGAAIGACTRSATARKVPIRVLMLSTMLLPEVVEYPDSGKVGIRRGTGERLFLGRLGEALDYWEGED